MHHANRARDHYLDRGQARAAARAQATTGEALRRGGRGNEARDQLTAALEVLRADPDTGTVRALESLATVEVFTGAPGADRLTTEALALGQALGVDPDTLGGLFMTRGMYLGTADRYREAVAYLRESVALATQTGDNARLGRALVNLSEGLVVTDPAAAAETARAAGVHLRRAGARGYLAVAAGNLVQALLALGDWDAAERELGQVADADGLAAVDFLGCYRGWLAALRGDAATAEAMLAALVDLRASEDFQDMSLVSKVEAFTAAARNRPEDALRHTRAVLAHTDALGISHEDVRWTWPLAARAAHDLRDTVATRDLLALLDAHPPGHLVPILKAERDLARARLAVGDGEAAAAAAFAAAISGLRELGSPYHLAHGLLDHAGYLASTADAVAARAATAEALGIAGTLRCQPLLDRAAGLTAEGSRVPA
jgi:tetratricopeptide (TPR) repeat protein